MTRPVRSTKESLRQRGASYAEITRQILLIHESFRYSSFVPDRRMRVSVRWSSPGISNLSNCVLSIRCLPARPFQRLDLGPFVGPLPIIGIRFIAPVTGVFLRVIVAFLGFGKNR
jgi:hypothetical protein